MIDRYTLSRMGAIWTQRRKYECWLEVELATCQAMEGIGQIPKGIAKAKAPMVTISVLTSIGTIPYVSS